MHPLDAWLKQHDLTREWLAKEAGTTTATVSRIIAGSQWTGRKITARIREITGLSIDEILREVA